jgi:hypothetical protein
MIRATTSVDPPGGNGTISVICRDGQVCARDARESEQRNYNNQLSHLQIFAQDLVGALLVREDATDLQRCPCQGSDLINVVRSPRCAAGHAFLRAKSRLA